jgi:CubicO group peptidase (beta-lactamase class C family)
MSATFPLPSAAPDAAGLDPRKLDRLSAVVQQQVDTGLCLGATVAVARHGRLVLDRTFGKPGAEDATRSPLWLLYSNTKVITAAALWQLFEDGHVGIHDPVARFLPDFARHGKGDITLLQVVTHRAGFPGATVPAEAWADHALLRRAVCDFVPEWEAGSRMHYHSTAAHWVLAAVIEAVTGDDYRTVLRSRVIAPLGLDDDIMVGVREEHLARAAPMVEPADDGRLVVRPVEGSAAFRRAGVPGGGGYGTARGMAAFYQMLVGGGALAEARVLGPRTVAFATRDFTGDTVDTFMGEPMHRGLGPHLRGTAPRAHGLGSLAPAQAFGHGGVGSSFCWGDPTSGTSFAFLSNARQTETVHAARTEVFSNLVHAAIL